MRNPTDWTEVNSGTKCMIRGDLCEVMASSERRVIAKPVDPKRFLHTGTINVPFSEVDLEVNHVEA